MFSCGDKHTPTRPRAILRELPRAPHLMKQSILALGVASILLFATVHAQDSPAAEEIPIQRCDGLPVIKTRSQSRGYVLSAGYSFDHNSQLEVILLGPIQTYPCNHLDRHYYRRRSTDLSARTDCGQSSVSRSDATSR